MTSEEWGNIIAEAIKRAGSQGKLALAIGVTQQAISQWKFGKDPRDENVSKVTAYLSGEPQNFATNPHESHPLRQNF